MLKELQNNLRYHFKNEKLLQQALTRRSATHQQIVKGNNENLEWLGDSVLNTAVSDLLLYKYPQLDEGALSQKRSILVSNNNRLLSLAHQLDLGRIITMDAGEAQNNYGRTNSRILSDTMEAVIGAIYLDYGQDISIVKAFVITHWKELKINVKYEAFIAICDNNINLLKALLVSGLDVNTINTSDKNQNIRIGDSLLYTAILHDNIRIIKLLLKAGADPNMETADYSFPLKIAATGSLNDSVAVNGHQRNCDIPYDKILHLLLKYNVNVNKTDKQGNTALTGAIWRGRVGTVKLLLEHGIDLSLTTNALHMAAQRGNKNMFEILIEQDKLDIDRRDEHGMTALHYAVEQENYDMVHMLLKSNAAANIKNSLGYTSLHLAVLCHTVDQESFGRTWRSEIIEIISLLLDYDEELLIIQDQYGRTARDIVRMRYQGQIEFINPLYTKDEADNMNSQMYKLLQEHITKLAKQEAANYKSYTVGELMQYAKNNKAEPVLKFKREKLFTEVEHDYANEFRFDKKIDEEQQCRIS